MYKRIRYVFARGAKFLQIAGVGRSVPLEGVQIRQLGDTDVLGGESFVRMPKYNFNKLLREILSTKGKTRIF